MTHVKLKSITNLSTVAEAAELLLSDCAEKGLVCRSRVPGLLKCAAEEAERLIDELCRRGVLVERECPHGAIALGEKFHHCFDDGKGHEMTVMSDNAAIKTQAEE